MSLMKNVIWCLLIVVLNFSHLSAEFTVSSPDGKLSLEIAISKFAEPLAEGEYLSYAILYNGKTLIHPSPFRWKIRNSTNMGAGLVISEVTQHSIREETDLLYGKFSRLQNVANEMRFYLRDRNNADRSFILTVRAYDEAVAFRFHICRMPDTDSLLIENEHTLVRVASGTAYALRLKHFRTPYENNYDMMSTEELPGDRPIALPLLIHSEEGPWIAIMEADLHDYPGMYLRPFGPEKGSLEMILSPLSRDTTLAAVLHTPCDLPWRVFMVGDHPGKFIESQVILNLSRPNRIEDPCWIRPGKVAWDWWSDRVVEGRNFVGGMNTETMKYYIDFAAQAGLEYMLIDAGWYGEHDTPEEDITTTIPEINLQHLLDYAQEKQVGIWLWVNWECVRDQMDRAFPLYESWGVKGVKVDYMNSDDQDMVRFYEKVCRVAAKYHLMVNFHGAYKPTGLRRTYPNLVTREGVLGLEWSKWSERCNPDHELILPFTRMLAGPMDFTPGAFQVASRKNFKARIKNPMAMGTRAHQLAMYVIYESPVQMLVDHPASYFGQTGLEFLQSVPTVWDETRFLDGEIGDYIILARRSGNEWYLGAMTDWTERKLEIGLDFLGDRTFMAWIFGDDIYTDDNYGKVSLTVLEVNGKSKLSLKMASGGGCAVRFVPTWELK